MVSWVEYLAPEVASDTRAGVAAEIVGQALRLPFLDGNRGGRPTKLPIHTDATTKENRRVLNAPGDFELEQQPLFLFLLFFLRAFFRFGGGLGFDGGCRHRVVDRDFVAHFYVGSARGAGG